MHAWSGIELEQKAHRNTFFGNNIINNNNGVSQTDTITYNRFYHNNFINNTQQVEFFRYLNYWNISYPSGGNYWSDYAGEDLYSGPYQNETGSDSIGDTPYVVSQYNQDNYPFLKSWGWDKTPPVISITSPSEDVEIRSSSPTIEWNGTDNTSGIDHYEIRLDNSSWINMGTNTTYTFTGVGDGTHIAGVKAFDKAGKPQITSVRFTVNTSPIGGLGYTEEIAITVVVLLAVASAIYLLKVRKKHLKRFL